MCFASRMRRRCATQVRVRGKGENEDRTCVYSIPVRMMMHRNSVEEVRTKCKHAIIIPANRHNTLWFLEAMHDCEQRQSNGQREGSCGMGKE